MLQFLRLIQDQRLHLLHLLLDFLLPLHQLPLLGIELSGRLVQRGGPVVEDFFLTRHALFDGANFFALLPAFLFELGPQINFQFLDLGPGFFDLRRGFALRIGKDLGRIAPCLAHQAGAPCLRRDNADHITGDQADDACADNE